MNNFVFLFVIALCGTRTSSLNVDRTNRILGGSSAADNQLLYMISLQQLSGLSSYTRGHRCGGALVTLRHAVTSATCLFDVESVPVSNGFMWVYTLINAADYRVFAGSAALTNDNSNDRHRSISRFTLHPEYRATNAFVNDIAVITLASAFPSNTVLTVPLSTNDATSAAALACTSSGWGSQNSTSPASTQLMHLQKEVVDQATCQPFYTGAGAMGNTQISLRETMICAQATGIYSSCRGDRGNPLVCNGNLNGILLINSNDCSGTPENLLRPEVYTRISSFRTWIDATAGASTFQPGMAVLAVIAIVQIITTNVLN